MLQNTGIPHRGIIDFENSLKNCTDIAGELHHLERRSIEKMVNSPSTKALRKR